MSDEPRTGSEAQRLQELAAEYEILDELGRGGTAVVYLARDRELGRNVAIKVIRSTYVDDPEVVARLQREAKTVARLQHPKIVTLYGTRRLGDGSVALVMQHVPGLPLKDVIRSQGPTTFDLAETILRDIGEALAYAHRRKIVHRDVKPDNIYFDREAGQARLSDFGIARPWDSDSEFTLPGMAIGTPAYMSPEQIDGEELDGRSDLYSLGLVGYDMLTGEAPWAGENVYNTIFKQKHAALPPLEARRQGIPADLSLAIRGCLAKDRDKRWKDVEEFLAVLDGRRPAEAAPLAIGGWRDLGEMDAGNRSPTPRDDSEIGAENDDTIRFHRDAEGPPGLAEDSGEDDAVADRPARPGVRDESSDLDRSSVSKQAGDRRSSLGPESPSSRRGRGRDPRSKRSRVALLLGGAVGVLALIAGTLLYVARPDGIVERALGSFEVSGDRQDATTDPAGAGGGSDPAQVVGIPPVKGVEDDDGSSPRGARPDVGPPTELSVLSGAGQVGRAGEVLPVPIAVALRDSVGLSVAGVTVSFEVVAGGGEVIPPSVEANPAGIAEARWRLGPGPGVHTVVATVDGRPSLTSEIDATATPRPPARIAVVTGAGQESQAGARLPGPIRIRVMDELGNPIPDAPVAFRSTGRGGSVEPSRATTDQGGIAQVSWTVGNEIGQDTLLGYLPGQDQPALAVVADVLAPRMSPRPTVAAGGTHTCALGGSGQVSCWGANGSGQLGGGGTERQLDPARVITGVRFARLAAGVSFTCGLSVEHRAYCWGANESGQLGIGSDEPRATPEALTTDARFIRLSAGAVHACGVALDGRMLCWGSNEFGQLGDGTPVDRTVPTNVVGNSRFSAVAVGWGHSCALDGEGHAFCWGRNSSGELGDGTGRSRSVPTAVAGARTYDALAAGSAHTCGLSTQGELFCWGQNSYGQLGTGGEENRLTPGAVAAGFRITDVVAGGVHTCALADDGRAYCWGRNAYGQLGDGTNADRATPTPVAGDNRFTGLSARGAHTCGTTVGGVTHCWGYNSDGQLGDGTRSTRPVPVRSGSGTL